MKEPIDIKLFDNTCDIMKEMSRIEGEKFAKEFDKEMIRTFKLFAKESPYITQEDVLKKGWKDNVVEKKSEEIEIEKVDNIVDLLKNRDHFSDFLRGKKGYLGNGDLIEYFDKSVLINGERYDKYVICPICQKEMRQITNTHLWRTHSITSEEFDNRYRDSPRISKFSAYLKSYRFKGKTYEEIFGIEKAKQLREARSNSMERVWENRTDQEKKDILKIGNSRTEEAIEKNILDRFGDIDINYREKALSYYGEECAWCGCDDKSKLVVHHKDANNYGEDNVFSNNDIDNLIVLCKSCHSKYHNYISTTGKWQGKTKIEKGFSYILDGLYDAFGINKKDVNFKDTPSRVARAFMEMLQGSDMKNVDEILSQNFPSEYTNMGMVVLHNIQCFSMCPHHFLPVKYDIDFGYIPDKNVLGISKIPRAIKLLAQAPVLQEDLTKIIIDKFDNHVKPLGSMVVINGYHMCMGARGIEMPNTATLTSWLSGNFEKESVRNEFLQILQLKKK